MDRKENGGASGDASLIFRRAQKRPFDRELLLVSLSSSRHCLAVNNDLGDGMLVGLCQQQQ